MNSHSVAERKGCRISASAPSRSNGSRTAAGKGFQRENGLREYQASVTAIPAFFRARKSDLGIPWSVITSCKVVGGTISDKLRRPNLLESHTATVRFAIPTITRLTLASRRLGVLNP